MLTTMPIRTLLLLLVFPRLRMGHFGLHTGVSMPSRIYVILKSLHDCKYSLAAYYWYSLAARVP